MKTIILLTLIVLMILSFYSYYKSLEIECDNELKELKEEFCKE